MSMDLEFNKVCNAGSLDRKLREAGLDIFGVTVMANKTIVPYLMVLRIKNLLRK